MSGWIKLQKHTPDKPKMWAIAKKCGISKSDAFLAFTRFYSWADDNTIDGVININESDVDDISRVKGFAKAMLDVEWLGIVGDGTLVITNFDRHNGKTAKARALEAEAKTLRRMSDKCRT